MGIKEKLSDYESGNCGFGTILFHKKQHKHSGSEEHVCLRGLVEGCEAPYQCSSIYFNKYGCFCTEDGQTTGGILVEEEKHSKLVETGAYGAHNSIEKAIEIHGREFNF